jgi:hypothetical protein
MLNEKYIHWRLIQPHGWLFFTKEQNTPDIDLALNKSLRKSFRPASLLLLGIVLLLSGCSVTPSEEPVRVLQIQQEWELQPGEDVAGHPIVGSLGDVSIDVGGDAVYAPFDGRVQPNDVESCFVYSSPEIPAYLFRLCGLRSARVGPVEQGQAIGRADQLQFAALRRQPDGTWAMIEPARDILQRTLTRPQ